MWRPEIGLYSRCRILKVYKTKTAVSKNGLESTDASVLPRHNKPGRLTFTRPEERISEWKCDEPGQSEDEERKELTLDRNSVSGSDVALEDTGYSVYEPMSTDLLIIIVVCRRHGGVLSRQVEPLSQLASGASVRP